MLPRSARLSLALLLALGTSAAGCGSETSSSTGDLNPARLPQLAITSPKDGICIEVPVDRPVGVPIQLQLAERTKGEGYDFTLAPPGTCGQTVQCGHIVLFVPDPDWNLQPNNSGSNLVIDVLSTPEKPLSGSIEVTAKLVNDDGAELLDPSNAPIYATATFEAHPSCGGGTGGTGGSTTTGTGGAGGSTTSTGGSTTTTGTGGAGGSTTSTGGSTTTGTGGAGGSTTSTGTGT
jgi:hypothetical protein